MNQLYKNIALWLIIIATVVLMFNLISYKEPSAEKVSFSEFIEKVEAGGVSEVTIQGSDIEGRFQDGKEFATYSPQYPELVEKLRENKVKILVEPIADSPSWGTIFVSWFPMILLIGVWIFFMRQMQSGGGKAMSFGKSKAKLLTEDQHRVTFKDVGGKKPRKIVVLSPDTEGDVVTVTPEADGSVVIPQVTLWTLVVAEF